jgi:archaellum component FlaC
MEWVSLILNVLFGGGFFISLVTLKSVKKEAGSKAEKAAAEARADEIKNVESAIKIWRGIAEDMSAKYNDMSDKCEALSKSVEKLTTEVNRLRLTNNRIIRLLDKITPENLEHVVAEIKNELSKD